MESDINIHTSFLGYFYHNKIYHGEKEILVHQPIHHVQLQIATALVTHDSIALLAEEDHHSTTICSTVSQLIDSFTCFLIEANAYALIHP